VKPFFKLAGVLALFAYLIAVAIAAYDGISYEFGSGWAWGAVILAICRFALPLSIGAFIGAWKVWQWHWLPALVLAAPGVLLFIPSVFMLILRIFKDKKKRA
jgi:hypothetical protein